MDSPDKEPEHFFNMTLVYGLFEISISATLSTLEDKETFIDMTVKYICMPHI